MVAQIGLRSGGGQIPVSSQRGPQLTPCAERRLIDRITAGTQLRDQRVERDALYRDRDEHLPLPFGQLLLDGTAHRGDEVVPLGVIDGTGPQASGQRVPVSSVESCGRTLPEVRPSLLDTSRTANLYAQVVNRLFPRSWASLVVIANRALSADW